MDAPLAAFGEQITSQDSLNEFRADVIEGLQRQAKSLPCKYLYDARGSALFEQICELDDYYLTRAELEIMERCAGEIGSRIGPRVMLIEYGSGSSTKTRSLLDHLHSPSAYVPVDISKSHLYASAASIASDYAQLQVLPVCADFMMDFELPKIQEDVARHVVYFPGSTIGNLLPCEAKQLLDRIARVCDGNGGLLIGVDLQKSVDVLEKAYNDSEGVTAEFNLNLLSRIQRELGADLTVEQFEHLARYDSLHDRIEIFIRSRVDQVIQLGEHRIELAAGELIHTEYSHKYTIEGFARIAKAAGFKIEQSWMDHQQYFGVLYLSLP